MDKVEFTPEERVIIARWLQARIDYWLNEDALARGHRQHVSFAPEVAFARDELEYFNRDITNRA